MSRTIFHTPRQLNPEQEEFLNAETNGNPIAPKSFKRLDRRFRRQFGAGITPLLVSRFLRKERRKKAEAEAEAGYRFWKRKRAG